MKRRKIMTNFNKGYEFIKELYLNSNPSIDISIGTEQIEPSAHTITISKYTEIQEKYFGDDEELKFQSNLFALNYAPQLING